LAPIASRLSKAGLGHTRAQPFLLRGRPRHRDKCYATTHQRPRRCLWVVSGGTESRLSSWTWPRPRDLGRRQLPRAVQRVGDADITAAVRALPSPPCPRSGREPAGARRPVGHSVPSARDGEDSASALWPRRLAHWRAHYEPQVPTGPAERDGGSGIDKAERCCYNSCACRFLMS
jgi:hypothetical protein